MTIKEVFLCVTEVVSDFAKRSLIEINSKDKSACPASLFGVGHVKGVA